MVGIISYNQYLSTLNQIGRSNSEILKSVLRLSTGKKSTNIADETSSIAMASDIKARIVSYVAALKNVSQASSMVNIAGDSLQTISNILDDQISLATQGASASVTSSQRALLNYQFQDNTTEIDNIVSSTSFNNINLIDGSFDKNAFLNTTTGISSSASASATVVIATPIIATRNIVIGAVGGAGGLTIGSSATPSGFQIDSATTAAVQMQRVVDVFANYKNYAGTDATTLANKSIAAKFNVTYNAVAGNLTITANSGGTLNNTSQIYTSDAAASLKVNGQNSGSGAPITFAGASPGIDNLLNAGTFSTGPTAFDGTATTIATGTVGDTILKSLTVSAQATTGIDLSNVSNNPAFIGKISGFEATYVTSQVVNANIKIGNYTYSANNIQTNYTADTLVTFIPDTPGAGTFTLQFAANAGETSVTNQTEANVFASRLNAAFSTIDIVQKRKIMSYSGAGLVIKPSDGSTIGDLAGSKFTMISNNFDNVLLKNIKITASATANAQISFIINDDLYQSGYSSNGNVNALSNSLTNAADYGFVNQSNPNQILILDYASATNNDLTTKENANALLTALNSAFGINNSQAAGILVGSNAQDVISINIPSASSYKLYLDSNNISQTLDITSQENATSAISILNNSKTIVSGMINSLASSAKRLDFIQNNVQLTIENLDAARSDLEDTDFAKETTKLLAETILNQSGIIALNNAQNSSKALLRLLE